MVEGQRECSTVGLLVVDLVRKREGTVGYLTTRKIYGTPRKVKEVVTESSPDTLKSKVKYTTERSTQRTN